MHRLYVWVLVIWWSLFQPKFRRVSFMLDSVFAFFPAPYIFLDMMSHIDCLAYIDILNKDLGT